MTGFYVFLAIAGIICIIVSFLLTEKLDGKKAFDDSNISDEVIAAIIEKNGYTVKKALEGQIENVKERAVEDTTIVLNRMANEKIMAVDEFSDTVIEKINQNHSEVIFLYNMLNEKEKELKELVADVNQAAKKNVASTKEKKATRQQDTSKGKEDQEKGTKTEKSMGNNTQQAGKRKSNSQGKKDKLALNESEKKREAHTREEILEMFEDGMSVTDIAQNLKMGKGEVKLIIDLYQGAKG